MLCEFCLVRETITAERLIVILVIIFWRAQAWGVPLKLYSCGNASTYQNYTYDANSKHFMTAAPANDPKKAYPALLEMVAGDGPQKVLLAGLAC